MSDAVDNAEVMLYAVSEKYKESGNCRLEASYAHQQQVEMIPLLLQEGYKPTGWLVSANARMRELAANGSQWAGAHSGRSHWVCLLRLRG